MILSRARYGGYRDEEMTKGKMKLVLVHHVMMLLATSPLSEVMMFSSPLSSASLSNDNNDIPTTTSTISRIFQHQKSLQRRRRGNPKITMMTATAEDNNEVFDNVIELANTTVLASSSTAENQRKILLDPRPRRERQSRWQRTTRPHRRKPSINPDDDMNRQLNNLLPKRFQYLLRDTGFLRLVLNVSVLVGLPTMKQKYPSVIDDFLQVWFGWNHWTAPKNPTGLSTAQLFDLTTSPASPVDTPLPRRRSVKYGDQSPNQIIELWEWNDDDDAVTTKNDNSKKKKNKNNSKETIIFVHGGAWGTGFPAMYSLVALPFLRRKKYNVAIVGYRTYPDANILQQADDVVDAITTLQRELEQQTNEAKSNKHTYTLIGHSSGSHICSLAMARGMLSSVGDSSTCVVDRFISLAGVFDIREHYRFETIRGLARISPMAPAAAAAVDCHKGRVDTSSRRRRRRQPLQSIFTSWSSSSPLHLVQDMTARIVGTDAAANTIPVNSKGDNNNNNNEDFLWSSSTSSENERIAFAKNILVIHSMDDMTCPYWYSEVFAEALREYNYAKTKKTDISSAVSEVVDLKILMSSGHAELLLELIYGGPTQDLVLGYLNET